MIVPFIVVMGLLGWQASRVAYGPSSQEIEPPTKPGRFMSRRASAYSLSAATLLGDPLTVRSVSTAARLESVGLAR